jgi:hypothetical protein
MLFDLVFDLKESGWPSDHGKYFKECETKFIDQMKAKGINCETVAGNADSDEWAILFSTTDCTRKNFHLKVRDVKLERNVSLRECEDYEEESEVEDEDVDVDDEEEDEDEDDEENDKTTKEKIKRLHDRIEHGRECIERNNKRIKECDNK